MIDSRKQDRIEQLRRRLARVEIWLARLRQVEARFPWLRLGALLAGLALILAAFQLLHPLFGWLVIFLAMLGFAWVSMRHQRVIDRMERAAATQRVVAGQIARAELDWSGIPPGIDFPAGPEHSFALDLYLPQLHRRMDTAASLGGSLRLAAWLANPIPDPAQIHRRQALVRELLDRPAFRTQLLVDGATINPTPADRWDGAGVLRWLEQHNLPAARLLPFLVGAGLLAMINLVLFALNAVGLLPPYWIATFAGYLMLQSLKYRESSEVFDEAYTLARHLQRLRAVLIGLQAGPYLPGSRLAELCRPFYTTNQRPERALRRIGLIVTAASLRFNPFFALLLNMLMPWDLFFAYQLDRYKSELRGVLPIWLEVWYELEALNSLAGFAADNPDTTFPELIEAPGEASILSGQALGHPLIPDPQRVSNDFTIDHLGEIVIITGSNMSGKSTFLRTVGVNLALAYAGSTVQAAQLRVLPMRLFTSMTLSDSLSDGISFFYAEVRRLRALLDQLESPTSPTPQSAPSVDSLPLFFLVDEIFRGTNNRERQIGSRAYTEALAGKHGAGLISTHDLELAHLADAIPLVRNQHFREEIHEDQMIFDYKIRPGSSPTTNALRIMALAGLPVPKEKSRENSSA